MASPIPLEAPVISAARSGIRGPYSATAGPFLIGCNPVRRSIVPAALLVALLAVGAAGCGEDDENGEEAAPPPAKAEDFPNPAGKTIAQLREGLGPGPVLSPSVSLLEPGRNRVGFGLFDRARKQIIDAPAALYAAPLSGGPVEGPYPARYESLEVKPQFQSEGVK